VFAEARKPYMLVAAAGHGNERPRLDAPTNPSLLERAC